MGILTVAKVAVENTAYSFDMLFEYSVPDFLSKEISAGKRVLVQFGNSSKKRVGIVFSVESGVVSTKKLKSISSVIDDEPLLTTEMLKTAHFVHDKYFCTYYDACKLFLPLGLSLLVNVLYAVNPEFSGIVSGVKETEIYDFLKDKKTFTKSDRIIEVCNIKKISILDKMVDEFISNYPPGFGVSNYNSKHWCYSTFQVHLIYVSENRKNTALIVYEKGGYETGITGKDFFEMYNSKYFLLSECRGYVFF